jgi:hypothetical protein
VNLLTPVNDSVQIEGIWLLLGTGLLLATDELTDAGSDYLLDHDGDLDRTPDARGHLVAADGRITMSGAACGETVVANTVIHGSALESSLTATVVADPCRWFGGRTTLLWVREL